MVEKLGTRYHLYDDSTYVTVLSLSTVRCEFGVLKNCYGEGDLELYEGSVDLQWMTGSQCL